MGLFDFFKNDKSNELKNVISELHSQFFPDGDQDIEKGAREIQQRIKTDIPFNIAKELFAKSFALAMISKDFSPARLQQHLSGYPNLHFNSGELLRLYNYLLERSGKKNAPIIRRDFHNKRESQIIRNTLQGLFAFDNSRMYYWDSCVFQHFK